MKKLLLIAFVLVAAACQPKADAPAKTQEPAKEAAKADDKKAEAPKADEKKADAKKADEKVTDAPKGAPASAPANMEGREDGHFGAAFTVKEDPIALSAVIDKVDDHADKTIKVSGKVDKVCKKKGCWMVLKSDKADQDGVRITMKDYGFFVPKQCDGQDAIVEGTISKKVVKEAMRKHLAEDQGKDPSGIKGDTVEVTIVANGIEIKKKG
mgnify:CR=1 FL=1